MIFPNNNKEIKGNIIKDKKTKNLLARIKVNQIAVLNHEDIDEMAAAGLIEKRVKVVINFSGSLTGKYPTIGLKNLIKAKIPVFDILNNYDVFAELTDEDEAIINSELKTVTFITKNNQFELAVKDWKLEEWEDIYKKALDHTGEQLNRFIDNTLEYASKEKSFVLEPLMLPKLSAKIAGKHVVVVVRGNNYREDLQAIKSYIDDYKPVLIGVDGGADALLEYGLKPNIIIGDMDSVSDKALKSGAEIIVHAYPNGQAPGLARIEQLGIKAKTIPSLGTSEDVAMLMAYEKGAELIVALGAHSNMIDFLEKGRKGMASTVLVRMKIGTKLVDAKGVSKLYHPRVDWRAVSLMGVAAITPILAISIINHDIVRILKLVWINIKMLFT